MKAADLIVGQKYTPLTKMNTVTALLEAITWKNAQKRGQNYLYYHGRNDENGDELYIFDEDREGGGDYYNPSDVIPYVETETKINNMNIHDQILTSLNVKEGNLVKITHKVPNLHLGWGGVWDNNMDRCIGKQGVITRIRETNGVEVSIEGQRTWTFPAQVIEVINRNTVVEVKISDDYVAKIYPGHKIQVGCQIITREIFAKISEEFNKK